MLERFILFLRSGNNVGMAMSYANRDNSAEAIEVSFACIIPDVLEFSFHQHQRLFVIEEDSRVEELLAQGEDLISRSAFVRRGLMAGGGQGGGAVLFFAHV